MKKLPLILGILMISSTAWAQAPLGYSGKLLTSAGSPVSDNKDITFAIYDGQAAGSQILSHDFSGVAVNGGFFNLLVPVSALEQAAIASSDGGLYVELTVDGEILSPRVPMAAVPWSYGGSAIASLSCASGQVAEWSASGWVCGGAKIESPACSDGQILKFAGSAWSCVDPYTDGDAVSAVSGSTLSLNTLAVTNDVTIDGKLETDGTAMVGGKLTAAGAALNGNTTIDGNLTVTGKTTIKVPVGSKYNQQGTGASANFRRKTSLWFVDGEIACEASRAGQIGVAYIALESIGDMAESSTVKSPALCFCGRRCETWSALDDGKPPSCNTGVYEWNCLTR